MMKNLLCLLSKALSNLRARLKERYSLNDIAAMLCFILGVYGERFFLTIYYHLSGVSPKMFCFICLMAAYTIITRLLHN